MSAPLAMRLRRAAASLNRSAGDPITLGTLLDAHGGANRGTLLVLLAAPCLIPVPGIAVALGIGLAVLGAQMLSGRQTLRLPARVASVPVGQPAARRILRITAAFYSLSSRWTRSRFPQMVGANGGSASRLAAITTAAMAALLVLPIPFGNYPAALALIALGIGLTTRDGLAVLVAHILGATAVAINVAVVAAAWQLGGAWLTAAAG